MRTRNSFRATRHAPTVHRKVTQHLSFHSFVSYHAMKRNSITDTLYTPPSSCITTWYSNRTHNGLAVGRRVGVEAHSTTDMVVKLSSEAVPLHEAVRLKQRNKPPVMASITVWMGGLFRRGMLTAECQGRQAERARIEPWSSTSLRQVHVLEVVKVSNSYADCQYNVKNCNTHSHDIRPTTLKPLEEKFRYVDEHGTPIKCGKQAVTQRSCRKKRVGLSKNQKQFNKSKEYKNYESNPCSDTAILLLLVKQKTTNGEKQGQDNLHPFKGVRQPLHCYIPLLYVIRDWVQARFMFLASASLSQVHTSLILNPRTPCTLGRWNAGPVCERGVTALHGCETSIPQPLKYIVPAVCPFSVSVRGGVYVA